MATRPAHVSHPFGSQLGANGRPFSISGGTCSLKFFKRVVFAVNKPLRDVTDDEAN